jgi:hypothetical protein
VALRSSRWTRLRPKYLANRRLEVALVGDRCRGSTSGWQVVSRKSGFVTHVTFLGTFDVHRRDWRALLRRMRLLRLGNKRQKTRVLRAKWQKRRELRKTRQHNPPLVASSFVINHLAGNRQILVSPAQRPKTPHCSKFVVVLRLLFSLFATERGHLCELNSVRSRTGP